MRPLGEGDPGGIPIKGEGKMLPKPPPLSLMAVENFGQRCPKCEYSDFVRKHRTHKYDFDKYQEYLKCICPRCDYSWNMKTADNISKRRGFK